MAFTSIVCPVPELDALARADKTARSPHWLAASDIPCVAHVTLLGPWVLPREVTDVHVERLREVLAPTTPFDATFDDVGRFEDRAVYCAPADPSPFVALTRTLMAAYPGYEPYSGQFGEIVPHCTVGKPGHADLAAIRAVLPVTSRVDRAYLYEYGDGAARLLAELPFGG